MKSLILSTAIRYLLPLLFIFSIFILLRGHNDPGGGFIGGLVAAAAFSLNTIAFGVQPTRQLLRVSPQNLISVGLLIAVCSGLYSLLIGRAFMTGIWGTRVYPAVGKLGTPVFFDIGVYLVVIGVTLTIIFALREES